MNKILLMNQILNHIENYGFDLPKPTDIEINNVLVEYFMRIFIQSNSVSLDIFKAIKGNIALMCNYNFDIPLYDQGYNTMVNLLKYIKVYNKYDQF